VGAQLPPPGRSDLSLSPSPSEATGLSTTLCGPRCNAGLLKTVQYVKDILENRVKCLICQIAVRLSSIELELDGPIEQVRTVPVESLLEDPLRTLGYSPLSSL
jgi:hypothetical protein